jgi:hypothetical protein
MASKIIHLAFLVLEMDVVEDDNSETFAMRHLTLFLERFSLGDLTRYVEGVKVLAVTTTSLAVSSSSFSSWKNNPRESQFLVDSSCWCSS